MCSYTLFNSIGKYFQAHYQSSYTKTESSSVTLIGSIQTFWIDQA